MYPLGALRLVLLLLGLRPERGWAAEVRIQPSPAAFPSLSARCGGERCFRRFRETGALLKLAHRKFVAAFLRLSEALCIWPRASMPGSPIETCRAAAVGLKSRCRRDQPLLALRTLVRSRRSVVRSPGAPGRLPGTLVHRLPALAV